MAVQKSLFDAFSTRSSSQPDAERGSSAASGVQKSLFGATTTRESADAVNARDGEAENAESRVYRTYESLTASELADEIRHHDRLYAEGQPEISDTLYDRLRLRLQAIDPTNPLLNQLFEQSDVDAEKQVMPAASETLSTSRVGKNGKVKVSHAVAMLSLGKAYSADEVFEWMKDIPCDFVASPKLDGLSCSLRYDQNGDLLVASTRGDGQEGDDITANVRYIDDIPKHVNAQNVEIRGEVYMPLTSFKKFGEAVMSPRNLAVGGLKQKDPAETAHYGLSFFGYEMFGESFQTEMEKLDRIHALGFRDVQHELVRHDGVNTLVTLGDYIMRMLEQRSDWDFDADGLVFKANDVAVQKKQGFTAHHPKHSIAFKFQGDEGETTLRSVDWQVAKSGIITPVANFDTIVLSGAAIQRATLVHAGHVETFPKDGGFTHLKLGSRVCVSRRGGVIPCLERVISEPENAELVEIPKVCPSCGAPTILKESETKAREDKIKYLYCSDPENCPSMGQALIENYTKTINCLGFGEKIIEALFAEKLVTTPADLYRLSVVDIALAIAQTKTDRASGEVDLSALLPQKLYDSIQSSRTMTLAQFLEALSIPNLGREMSRLLEKKFRTLAALRQASLEEICNQIYSEAQSKPKETETMRNFAMTIFGKIHDGVVQANEDMRGWLVRCVLPKNKHGFIQPLIDAFKSIEGLKNASLEEITHCLDSVQQPKNGKKALSIHNGLFQRRALIDDLCQYVTIIEPDETTNTAPAGPFSGMSFLFTGTLESMKREEAQKRVEALGGTAANSVTKTLSVLVATNNTSTKWKKAEELNAKGVANIQLWTEDRFLEELQKVTLN